MGLPPFALKLLGHLPMLGPNAENYQEQALRVQYYTYNSFHIKPSVLQIIRTS